MTLSIKGTSEQIADALRAEIESGDLTPGSPLNQVQIADRFKLSRIPVREALRHLEAEGYLTYLPNKGAVVARTPNASEMLEIIELREVLEVRLIERAIENADADLVARAAKAMNLMNQARDEASVRGSHERFHTVFFGAAHRPLMAETINAWRFRLQFDRQQAFLRSARRVHRQLLAAFSSSDARGATQSVREEYALMRTAIVGKDALRRLEDAADGDSSPRRAPNRRG
ncbi:MAG: GntR family transcriptional regulator [Candidatus Cybelea sp.]